MSPFQAPLLTLESGRSKPAPPLSGSVARIQRGTFDQCNSLMNLTISNGVTSIGDTAFTVCSSLTDITLPDSVISIGIDAFEECYSLTNITLPNSLRSIGKFAFGFSGLTSVTIPGTVTD